MSKKYFFSRKQIYTDIWRNSLSKTALNYGIKATELKEICSNNNIPTPSSGYFTRRSWGKDVSNEEIELPISDTDEITYIQEDKTITRRTIKKSEEHTIVVPVFEEPIENVTTESISKKIEKIESSIFDGRLEGYDETFRNSIIEEATKALETKHSRHHKQIVSYQKEIDTYTKQHNDDRIYSYSNRQYKDPDKPAFFDSVSKESISRVKSLLDSIYCSVEKLGCTVNSDLSITLNKDTVRIGVEERKTKIEHKLTKEEAKKLVEYEDEKKRHSYAYKPKIPKYDHLYNGSIILRIYPSRFSDSNKSKLEELITDIIITIFELLYSEKTRREDYEEKERIRQEEKQKKISLQERKNTEIEMTLALINEADDYFTATKIRSYVEAVSNSRILSDKQKEWIKWASDKADWFDPTISKNDEYLGYRDHGKSNENKELQKKSTSMYYW